MRSPTLLLDTGSHVGHKTFDAFECERSREATVFGIKILIVRSIFEFFSITIGAQEIPKAEFLWAMIPIYAYIPLAILQKCEKKVWLDRFLNVSRFVFPISIMAVEIFQFYQRRNSAVYRDLSGYSDAILIYCALHMLRKCSFSAIFIIVFGVSKLLVTYWIYQELAEDDSMAFQITSIVGNVLLGMGIMLYLAYSVQRERRTMYQYAQQVKDLKSDFQDMIDHCPTGMAILKDGHLIFANRQVMTTFQDKNKSDAEDEEDELFFNMGNPSTNPEREIQKELQGIESRMLAMHSVSSSAAGTLRDKLAEANTEAGLDKKILQLGEFYIHRENHNVQVPEDTQSEDEEGLADNFSIYEVVCNVLRFAGDPHETIHLIFNDATTRSHYVKIKEVNSFKNKLLRTVSHELKTPLQTIFGSLESLQDNNKAISRDTEQMVNLALNAAYLLNSSVNDLVDYAQMDSGNLRITPVEFDLQILMSHVFSIISSVSEEKKINLKIGYASHINLNIENDEIRLQQILLKVLSYLVKYGVANNPLEVYISESADKRSIILDMTKQVRKGIMLPGIDNESKKVQSPQKFNSKESTVFHNASLDLALRISIELSQYIGQPMMITETTNGDVRFRLIIEKSPIQPPMYRTSNTEDSVLDIELEPEVGLRHYLPLMTRKLKNTAPKTDGGNRRPSMMRSFRRDATGPRSSHARSTYSPTSSIKLPSCATAREMRSRGSEECSIMVPEKCGDVKECRCPQVLIVDDEPLNHIIVGTLLKQLGLSFEKASDGKQALDIILKMNRSECCRSFKLILLDYEMPLMKGPELANILMERFACGELVECPVVGFTAYSMEEELQTFMDAGVVDILIKPCTKDAIVEILEKWMKD